MKYYIDLEFDGQCLLSIAIVPQEYPLKVLYLAVPSTFNFVHSEWVADNVIPFIEVEGAVPDYLMVDDWAERIEKYFAQMGDATPHIIADWPKDIEYFCRIICHGPAMIKLDGFTCEVIRVDPWEDIPAMAHLDGAVRHNALWDARMLWHSQETNWG